MDVVLIFKVIAILLVAFVVIYVQVWLLYWLFYGVYLLCSIVIKWLRKVNKKLDEEK